MSQITYRTGNDLDIDELIALYKACTLGGRRPVEDRERMERMVREANLVITAWDGPLVVGISRSLTDFVFVTYLADLAIRESHQKLGIGKELIRRTQEASGQAKVVLIAAPGAENYYPRIGMTHHPSAWTLNPDQELV